MDGSSSHCSVGEYQEKSMQLTLKTFDLIVSVCKNADEIKEKTREFFCITLNEHISTVNSLQKQYKETVNSLQKQYKETVNSLQKQHKETVDDMKTKNNDLINKMCNFEYEKKILLIEQRPLRCITRLRTKIARVEGMFGLSVDLPIFTMIADIFVHVERLKKGVSKDVREKVEALENETRVKVLNFCKQGSTNEVTDPFVELLLKDYKDEIMQSSVLDDASKTRVEKVVDDIIRMNFNSMSISDRYSIHQSHRLVRWMYSLSHSRARRIVAIREAVQNDPDVDLSTFCSTIAHLYAISWGMYFPGTSVISQTEISIDDILDVLENYYDVNGIILKSVKILFTSM